LLSFSVRRVKLHGDADHLTGVRIFDVDGTCKLGADRAGNNDGKLVLVVVGGVS